MKIWLNERYPVWQLEEPTWFTDAAIASIPADMLPKEALRDRIMNGGV